ncbi:type I restriction enzyme HsdR N-terminal domain-containing protein [Aestuariimicrobium sp. p3-SID1156]|uniref:type I restriction endonuclease n=1 Tax=Aestuariimicrobium sp. p3-SID1156 TaxID=2916038 RepID=UPI00223B5EA5|nr:type I restriction endonuclease [Aestuariimicrobium sp. p3-SID1156]MCT1460088.1 type I restriction enzyme HsdR N-terminal domain-containing protein [Aestuariimicrobium sp. p3-SID1156]
MAFEDALADTAKKLSDYGDSLLTEEATKNALVMPFISRVLGYDVFNPQEVVPEFVADVGSRKGEKIDYAIMRDGVIQMLIEAKQVGAPLSLENSSQLTRYFTVCSARIGVLTNGRHWLFYTDLDKPNVMDSKPFLRLDLSEIDPNTLPELKKLTKDTFDLESVMAAAEELKYVSAVKAEVAREFATPSTDLVRLLTKRVYEGSITAKVQTTFEGVVAKALRQYINDQVNARLKTALDGQPAAAATTAGIPSEEVAEAVSDSPIQTTAEEAEAFLIVRAILASEVEVDRVVARDRQSYFGVLLDDNNRKPICRFHFNSQSVKYLGTFDQDKVETRHQLFSANDLYKYADVLRSTVRNYL